ncbi:MAG: tRNA guanosine(34) transglycosylase Tgt [Flavobacteriales bacterium]|nr:tRNA guanosine(34) transglycosylase Tgt [Flavobacteriales bacterium]
MASFQLEVTDQHSSARAGALTTDHGEIKTPIFMPVGTAATVKAVHQYELESEVKAQIILGNTYHLYLRPGMKVMQSAGGLHKFMNWQKPILTDSGGYQVYSLSEKRKIKEEGVTFKSHIDGSSHTFSPELAIDIQREIGADIIMAFDECTPWPCSFEYAENSMEMTHRWLKRCVDHFQKQSPLYGHQQTLAGIVQGSTYPELRKRSAEFVNEQGLDINAIGGLSVGEPAEELYKMTSLVCGYLEPLKPRYLMGVGTPQNILECISMGIDMFDCVMPTRNARNGTLFSWDGMMNIKNEKWKNDHTQLDPKGTASVDSKYSKAYLRHLIISKEILGAQISSIHNLAFYLDLVIQARQHIIAGDFARWKEDVVPKLSNRL